MAISAESKVRDRGRTEANILAAAKHVLAEAGFQGFGVNAVARRAGCDKQLIYRYFGGIEGLVDAIGDDLAGWVTANAGVSDAIAPTSYGALIENMMLGFLSALRRNPLVQKIAAWEIAESSELVTRLGQSRGRALAAWMAEQRGTLTPPPGCDAPAINALMIAALQHLVLSAAASGAFAGLRLDDEADWDRVRDAAIAVVRAIYGTSPAA